MRSVLFEGRGRWGHLPSIADRIDASGDCWEWTGYLDKRKGYGYLNDQHAHRALYQLLVGPVDPSFTVDHLCRNHACVNPDHMEVVSRGENVLRGYGPVAKRNRQSHCINGHPFNEANTYLQKRPTGSIKRACRACHRDDMRARRQK